ncbi:hypothetical protein [Natrinema altunense]|uniref:Twin-arginine translocation signal domain-containing protein n=1 Tax=Natrinema altunense (strain JCM 12890 / CGMCC 1.3731 / AJ2) TaxID=1227494 RepID=L9ZR25_NATA2|nr:hypothetical protein [Natrinema altunense]ELY88521.1 hypothetical protein C485_06170 [Natrinema altunense JCM 12890]
MTGRRGRHRRQFLAGCAAIGGVTVAGCNGLPWSDDTGPTFTAADAATVVTDPAPPIEWPVPVVPAASAVDEGLERVDALLADVPDPLDAETVPNGVVREEIRDSRDSAREHRAEAAAATGDGLYHALHTTRDARETARSARATFAAIDDDRLVEIVRDERREVRSIARDQLESVAYRGSEDRLLRSALVYARLESDLERVTTRLGDRRWDVGPDSTVVDIGTGAGAVEFGAATTAVWDHLDERHRDRLAEPTDVTGVFDAALEASAERVDAAALPVRRDARDWLADIDADLDDRLEQVLWRAIDPVSSAKTGLRTASDSGQLGRGLHEAVRFEQRYRALERVRNGVEDGTVAVPETVDEIRTARTAAVDAAASVRESLTDPSLGMYVLAETLRSLEWTDDRVRRAADNDAETGVSLVDEYGEYTRLRAQFEVLPDAVAAFRTRLRSA